jgi:RNA polymerase sigma-70 factor (ECF subfamily)
MAKTPDGLEHEFEELFQRFHQVVYRFLQRRGHPPAEALDLTQETFLRVWRGLGTSEGLDDAGAFIFRIAWNVHVTAVRQAHRKKRERKDVPLDELAPADRRLVDASAVSPVEKMVAEEEREALHKALETLAPQGRRCVEMRLAGLGVTDIALAMKLTVGTVKAHLFQVRRHLKKSLGPRSSDEDA